MKIVYLKIIFYVITLIIHNYFVHPSTLVLLALKTYYEIIKFSFFYFLLSKNKIHFIYVFGISKVQKEKLH